jgi:hypothetical protein
MSAANGVELPHPTRSIAPDCVEKRDPHTNQTDVNQPGVLTLDNDARLEKRKFGAAESRRGWPAQKQTLNVEI